VERRLLDPRRSTGRLDERKHVLLSHSATSAGARDLGEVHAVLFGDALHDR
jgi:hypothetical protein